uniref:Uncharacterized protein n=1 Tax=Haemonchus placei TaxID=6290 RepID=A0A0N4X751_HAEPC
LETVSVDRIPTACQEHGISEKLPVRYGLPQEQSGALSAVTARGCNVRLQEIFHLWVRDHPLNTVRHDITTQGTHAPQALQHFASTEYFVFLERYPSELYQKRLRMEYLLKP